jgi:hypothetical protein
MSDNVYCLGCGAAFPIDADPYPLNGGMCGGCIAEQRRRPWQIIAENERLREHATRLAEAIRLTREYIDGGTGERLPAIEGWEWFDALHAHDELFGTTYAKHADAR